MDVLWSTASSHNSYGLSWHGLVDAPAHGVVFALFFLFGVAEAACWELGVAKGKGAEHFDCVV